MADSEQLSFFSPVSTATGQTAWTKEEGDRMLEVIRARAAARNLDRVRARQRAETGFHDRRQGD